MRVLSVGHPPKKAECALPVTDSGLAPYSPGVALGRSQEISGRVGNSCLANRNPELTQAAVPDRTVALADRRGPLQSKQLVGLGRS